MNVRVPKEGPWAPNLNTLVQVIGIVVIVFSVGKAWSAADSRIGVVEKKVDAAEEAQDDLDTRADTAVNRLDGFGFRIAALESKAPETDKALEELQQSISDQSGDLKVIREILTRIEKGEGAGR